MKTFINIITLVSVAFMMLFCNSCESFLSETPKDFLSPENIPNTEEESNMLLLGALYYLKSNDFERSMDFLAECTTDAVTYGAATNVARDNLNQLEWESNNEFIYKIWLQLYRCINASNIMIQKVPSASSMTDDSKDMYVAAARYLRGMSYFYLVRLFNDVLYLDSPVEDFTSADNLQKTPAKEIYGYIIEDLKYAETYLPVQWSSGTERPTRVAAKSLLSWVYLTMAGYPINDSSKWALAASKAKEVIDNKGAYGVKLEDNFADLWLVANRFNSESIFAINYAEGVGDNQATVEFRPLGSLGTEVGWGFFYSLHSYMNKFDDRDKRKKATFLTEIVSEIDGKTYTMENDYTNKYPHAAKWFDAGRYDFSERNKRTDAYIPIIRYGYVLLIYAEAENEVNGPGNAYSAVNELRERAGLDPLSGLSPSQFREAIRDEWMYETTHERLHRFNLVRWGTYLDRVKEFLNEAFPAKVGNATDSKLFFPCPEHDALINPNLK